MAVFSIYLGAMGPLHDKNKIRPVDLIIGQADFGVPAQAGVVGKDALGGRAAKLIFLSRGRGPIVFTFSGRRR
jgi:hypothetical protein